MSYHIDRFNKTEKDLKITKVNLEHNHPISPQIYSMYPRNRQANNSEMEKILKIISLGAGVKETIDDFNKKTDSKMKPRDFYNYRIKNINLDTKDNSERENLNFRQIVDEIRDDKDNAIYLRVDLDKNIMECCFLDS